MNSKKIKIAVIRQHFPSNNKPTSSYWVYEQVRDLSSKSLSFLVISPQPYIPKPFRSGFVVLPVNDNFKGIQIIRPKHFRIPNYKLYYITNWFLSRAIYYTLKSSSPSILHGHFGNDGAASLYSKKKFGIPLITSFYGYDLSDKLKELKPFYHRLSLSGDLFLALSEDMKKDLIQIGFPKERVLIHHLGVDFNELGQYKQNRNDESFVFLVVARFTERKGIHDTIQAFAKVAKEKINVQLRIVGNGPYKTNLFRLVEELGLGNNVSFIDNFLSKNPRATVLQEMANCDVFMLNSYITIGGSKEGTPLVIMEAQGLGKPCIATKHAGIPEIVQHKHTGVLVEERNVNEIADAMLDMIDNPKLTREYGLNGQNHISKEFNNEIQQKRLLDIYMSVLILDKKPEDSQTKFSNMAK